MRAVFKEPPRIEAAQILSISKLQIFMDRTFPLWEEAELQMCVSC